MTITMPRVVQRPTPNYSPVAIRHDLLVLHVMEGGYAGSVAWMVDPRAKASAHFALREDGAELTQLAPANEKAWAQCSGNSAGLSLELPGRTADGLPDALWRAAAVVWGWASIAYDIPPVWAAGGVGRGLAQHHDGGLAWGGHVECSGVGSPEWMRFVGYVQSARAELKALPSLPTLALHGLPGPADVLHEASTVDPTPSHGGAARNEPGDVHAHPTPSGYPAHSIAALQSDLTWLGVAHLDIDGGFGPMTQAALRRFQATHGLTIDGKIGPASWAAIDAAMAKAA